jgi:arylsulfatase A-like enzyme
MDDQRPGTIGALNHPVVRTPSLDRLVREGVCFERAFCTTPICTPARAEMLTGCTSFNNGVTWFQRPRKAGLTLLPQHFQAQGYRTMHVGKWHNEADGHPRELGFERTRRVFGLDNLNRRSPRKHWPRFAEGPDDRTVVEGHSTELFADAALEELNAAEASGEARPWLMHLCFHAPHDPFDCPPPFQGMYDPQRVPLPESYAPEHPIDNGEMLIRDELLLPWPRTPEAVQRYAADYYAMISHADHHIGRLLDWLDRTGHAQDTLVVFTSDHGLAIGSHGLIGKESMHEHSLGVPLILRGPGLPADQRRPASAMAHHVDLMPTLCDLCGLQPPESARDGGSLLPLIHGRTDRARREVFGQFRHPDDPRPTSGRVGRQEGWQETQRMLRTDRWKLMYYPQLERFRLYDLDRDPHEGHDLLTPWRPDSAKAWRDGQVWAERSGQPPADRETALNAANDLRGRLLNAMAEVDDPALPLLEAYPAPEA